MSAKNAAEATLSVAGTMMWSKRIVWLPARQTGRGYGRVPPTGWAAHLVWAGQHVSGLVAVGAPQGRQCASHALGRSAAGRGKIW